MTTTDSYEMPVEAKVSNPVLLAERHRTLVGCATELFLKKGFHETSVREIATATGWQMGTLYTVISRKTDILALISQEIMNDLWEGLRLHERKSTATESLRVAAEYYFRSVYRLRREIRLLYRESATLEPEQLVRLKNSELREREFFAGIIQWGIERGEFEPVDAEIFAHNIIIVAHMWSLKSWALSSRFTHDEYMNSQLALIFAQLEPRSSGRADS